MIPQEALLFDPERLPELTRGDVDLQRKLVDLYRREAVTLVRRVRTSLMISDREELLRAVHTLKGAAGNVGADRLRLVALEVEEAALSPEPGVLHAAVTNLEEVHDETLRVLRGPG
mgnify:CR=1 FL=1